MYHLLFFMTVNVLIQFGFYITNDCEFSYRLFPPRPSVNKFLWFIYADNITTTKGGFKVMAASAYPMHNSKANWSQLVSCSSPREVILGSNVEHQMYCHLLCGLRNSDSLDGIRAPYAIGLIQSVWSFRVQVGAAM